MEEEFFSKAVDLCWCLFLMNIMNAAVSQKLPFILIIFITIYMWWFAQFGTICTT